MKPGPPGPFGVQLKALREAAGYTQEELATIAGLSVHGVSALERGERRRPHVDTVRALSAALDLTGATRDALLRSARAPAPSAAVDELGEVALPLPPTSLLGRETDLQTLTEWLADPDVRLVTLTGPGGAGKTRLALEIAHAIASDRLVRVVFVPLAPTRHPSFVAPAIADALGLSDGSAVDLPMRARVACEGRPMLLLLDNFEQLLDAAPLIAELLSSVATLRVLTTSRAPLHVRGEREYRVEPLALEPDAEEMSPADLARSPAVRLFVERVRDVQPDFRLTSANGPTVAAICRRLDALPLALELAARWMKGLTPADLLRRLNDDVLLSAAGPRDLPERQQTMNATVAWSYQLLDVDEQRALSRFGVLPGHFPIEAAAAVLAGRAGTPNESDALYVVAGLIDKSLLVRAPFPEGLTRPQFHMLETVRAYAAHELSKAGDREDALEGLVRYATHEARLAASGLLGPSQAEWLDRVRQDLASYRVALSWLIENGRAIVASEIASGLMFFWWIRGHAAEGLRWYEQALHLQGLPPATESRALLGAAVMCYAQGELERARVALARARTLAHAGGDEHTFIRTVDLSARVEWGLGNLQAAHDGFIRAFDGFQALAIPWGAGNSLIGMAGVFIERDENVEAARLLDEATSLLRDEGPWFLSRAFFARAILAVGRGLADDALELVRESLTRIRDLHDKYALIHALVPLAAAAALKGDTAWAARVLGARDAVTEHTGATVVVKPVHVLKERVERDVRARLGPDRWAQAYAAGRRTSLDTLLQEIDVALTGGHPKVERRRKIRRS